VTIGKRDVERQGTMTTLHEQPTAEPSLNSEELNSMVTYRPSSGFHATCASAISLIRRPRPPFITYGEGLAARHFVALPNDVIINKKNWGSIGTFVIFLLDAFRDWTKLPSNGRGIEYDARANARRCSFDSFCNIIAE
jgi:hypothetical protein